MPSILNLTGLRFIVASALIISVGACVSPADRAQDQEQMLAAAGFIEKPASTPERQARLAALPPFKILSQDIKAGGIESVGYVFADPQFCQCIFVGDPGAYQRYQRMAYRQKMAAERVEAQEMREENAMDWGMWGPYDYWGGENIVRRR
jgi:hypothetical protein